MKISPRGELYMNVRSSGLQSTDADYEIRSFISADDSMIIFKPKNYKLQTYDSLGYSVSKSKSFSTESYVIMSVKKKDIRNFMYASPKRYRVNRFFAKTGWLSIFTSLIVAPLISIHYKNWGFDKTRYFWTAGTALGYSIISYAVCLSTETKYYGVGERQRHSWKIAGLVSD